MLASTMDCTGMEGFEIRLSSSQKGKGLFAKRSFRIKDVILEENPVVSCQFAWNAAYCYLACDHCMRPLETPEQNARRLTNTSDIVLPHPECYEINLSKITSCEQCHIQYCSEECKKEAFNAYHSLLCYQPSDEQHPIMVLLDVWKQMHLPPETTSILLIARILALIQQSSNPEVTTAIIKQFCHRTVNEDAELAHKLLGDQFAKQLSTLRDLMSNVINGEHVQPFLTQEGFNSLMALVGTNGQGIGSSPLSIWAKNCMDLDLPDTERAQVELFIDRLYQKVEEESGDFINTEGSGLFRLQSSCNHSCDPNAEVCFPYGNHRLQLRATKPLMPGDEISISYLDECSLQRSRHSRQKELALNYMFLCWCPRCVEEAGQPECTSEEEMSDHEPDDDD